MDLGSIAQSLQVGLGQVPPVAIAIGLLAGPTAFMIGYRFVTVTRRMRMTSEVHAATLWVCHSCRSVSELRLNRCYRCGSERGAIEEAEVVIDRPASPVRQFEVPAGSPFMAVAQHSQGIPVMDPATGARDPVAVGLGGDAKFGAINTAAGRPRPGRGGRRPRRPVGGLRHPDRSGSIPAGS